MLLLTAVLACDRVGRVRECRRVAQLVNARFDEVSAQVSKGTPASFASAAVAYKALAKAVRERPYSGDVGRALTEEYAGVLEQIAPAVTSYAESLQSGDAQRVAEARRALARLKRTEHATATRVDAFCNAPR